MASDEYPGPGGHQFSTCDPGRAEQMIQDSYQLTGGARISGDTTGFRFSQSVWPGRGFALSRFRCATEIGYGGPQEEDLLCVDEVREGRLSFATAHGEVRAAAGGVCLAPPHEPWRAVTDAVDIIPVVLDRTGVNTTAAQLCGLEPADVVFTGLEPLSPAVAAHWHVTVIRAGAILASPELAAAPLVGGEAFRMLTAALLTTFPNTATAALTEPAAPGTDPGGPGVVRRAVAFIEANADQDIGLGEIAAAARIGARGVQHAFRKHRDTTPMEYLRQVRMDRAHRALQAADPTRGDRVAAVAARWGFVHAGRFSVEYRRRYGCSPSKTLRD